MTSGNTPSTTRNSLESALREQATRTVLFHSAVAGRLGITPTDLSCLNVLSMDGVQTPGRLAERLGITRGGAITAMIDRLEQAGFVRRNVDPKDRRRALVSLVTDRTAGQVTLLFSELGRAIGEQLAGYDDELALLAGFVTATNEALIRATEGLRRTETGGKASEQAAVDRELD